MREKEQKKKESIYDNVIEIKELFKNLPKPRCPICGGAVLITHNVRGEIILFCPKHGVVERK